MHGLTDSDVKDLRVGDFEFASVDREDTEGKREVADFISRHEWLGKMGMYPTHRYTAHWNGILAGAVVMDMPNAFATSLLPKDYHQAERLISRGACISWSPKNLASSLIMWSIKWAVKHTEYRLFTAYSDPEAGELGSIYQACNFYYLGNKFGTGCHYFDPERPQRGWFSDRRFRSKEFYKYYADELNVDYVRGETLTPEKKKLFHDYYKEVVRPRCKKRSPTPKHKYAYVLGADKRETRRLREFIESKIKGDPFDYPKVRGC